MQYTDHADNLGIRFDSIAQGRAQLYQSHSYSGSKNSSSSSSSLGRPDRITLVVDETRFVVEPELFRARPNTMLGR